MRATALTTLRERIALLLIVGAPISLASGQGSVSGVVRDSVAHPIAGAEVLVVSLGRSTHTDDAGHYELRDLAPGMRAVQIRRIGYASLTRVVQVTDGATTLVDLVLRALVTPLDTVVSRDTATWREAPWYRDFEENRRLGLGHFLTRADLEKLRGRPLAEGFVQILGFEVVPASHGPAAWIASSRGRRSLSTTCNHFENGAPSSVHQICEVCYPLVYLDVALLSRQDVVDINRFPPEQIEAVEAYASGAQTPPRYAVLNSECGVVVLHTRRP